MGIVQNRPDDAVPQPHRWSQQVISNRVLIPVPSNLRGSGDSGEGQHNEHNKAGEELVPEDHPRNEIQISPSSQNEPYRQKHGGTYGRENYRPAERELAD